MERILLTVTVLLKGAALWRRRELMIGFDIGDHLERSMSASWWAPPLQTTYYGYHPPFGFAIPHLLIGWNVQPAFAHQIFATGCSIVALLALRATLSSLGLLKNAWAVLFLYFWAGMPILVNCGVSFNLDIAILACASVALWLSVALQRAAGFKRLLTGVALAATLSCGPMIKYNGLLIFSIPPLVAFSFSLGHFRQLISRVALAGAISLIAILCVLPYYTQRYYQETGRFFPRNNEFWNADHVQRSQDLRDENLSGFFAVLFLEGWIDLRTPPETRHTGLMLSDTWKDFWIGDELLYTAVYQDGQQIPPSMLIAGTTYRFLFLAMLLLGLVAYALKWKLEPISQLGIVFLAVAALHIAAIAYYCYLEADPLSTATKGIYVLPATWAAAFLCMYPFRVLPEDALGRAAPYSAVMLGAWLAWNHLWPVY